MLNDHQLETALDAFCRRHIEGHAYAPTGASWDALGPEAKNYIRETYIGPLHAAFKAAEEIK